MKKDFFKLFSFAIGVIFFAIACSTKTSEKAAVYEAETSACDCESNWFPHAQTPAPAEGNGSPFDVSSTTNCIFHQWSWQKFLWLTKPLASGNPLFIDSLKQVNKYMEPVSPISGISLVLDDSIQAGGTNVVLTSNSNYANDKKSHTVYYSIFANDILTNTSKLMKSLILKKPSLINNDFVFPVGSLELKISWIDINSLPAAEVKNYYTRTAILMPSKQKVTVALLGMHVVGVVKNHPEFIWATFEHKNMAPNYDWKSTVNQDLPVTSNSDMLFFKKGYNANYQNLMYNAASKNNENVFTVYQKGVPKTARGKYMVVSQTEPINEQNILVLNKCANTGLTDVWQNYFYNGSIWINTDGLSPKVQADTIVALGYNIGNTTSKAIARGSVAAFNLTMETFQQAHQSLTSMDSTSITNCLSCHAGTANIGLSGGKGILANSPLYLSHIFRSYLNTSPATTKANLDVFRAQDIIDLLELRKRKK